MHRGMIGAGILASIVLLALAHFVAVSQQAEDSKAYTETILRGLENRADRIRSLSGYVTREFYNNPEGGSALAGQMDLYQYFWAHDWQQVRLDIRTVVFNRQKATPPSLVLSLYNGQTLVTSYFGALVAKVAEGPSQEALEEFERIPRALEFSVAITHYQPTKQLREKVGGLQLGPDQQLSGVSCKVLEWRGEEGSEKWWIAPEWGFLTVKQETVSDRPGASWVRKRIWLTEEATEVEPGLWVPIHKRMLALHRRKEEIGWTWGYAQRFRVTDLQVNKDLPPDPFSTLLVVGTRSFPCEGGEPLRTIGGDVSELAQQVVDRVVPSDLLSMPE